MEVITKAVIPAAGLGTRFLPVTKSIPKELLPLLNKPAIHYILDEGLAAALNEFIIITSKEKKALEHYLQPDVSLETQLRKQKKEHLLDDINQLIAQTSISFVEQPEPLGLGHAILMAKHHIGNNFFAVFLPDDFVLHDIPAIQQLAVIAEEHQATVIAVKEVPRTAISAYGSVAIKKQLQPDLVVVDHLVEKPSPEQAPSTLAVIGRYILSPHIFDAIEIISSRAKGEIQLTDALSYLVEQGEPVLAYTIKGDRFDLGTPPGWLMANLALALRDPGLSSHIKTALTQILELN